MENLFAKRSIKLFHSVPKIWYCHINNLSGTSATVDLAHKVFGDIASTTPIIILHGLLGSKRNWNSMATKLQTKTKRPVIAVDLRNHGESPHTTSHLYPELAADVARLLSKYNLKDSILLGHSMGGRTAMVLALTEPQRVSQLIVVDISPVSFPSVENDFFPRLIEVMKTVKFDTNNLGAARGMAKNIIQASGVVGDAGTLNFILTNVGKRNDKLGWLCNVDVLKNYFDKIAMFPSELSGKMYQGPTLFIAGELSHFLPASDLKEIKRLFPQATLEVVSGAHHNVHMNKPDDFERIVSRFISEYSLK